MTTRNSAWPNGIEQLMALVDKYRHQLASSPRKPLELGETYLAIAAEAQRLTGAATRRECSYCAHRDTCQSARSGYDCGPGRPSWEPLPDGVKLAGPDATLEQAMDALADMHAAGVGGPDHG